MVPFSTGWKNHNLRTDKRRSTLVSFSGYPRTFATKQTQVAAQYPWIKSLDGGGIRADDFNGWAPRDQLTLRVLDFNNLVSADVAAGAALEGQTVTIATGFEGLPQSQFATVATMQVDHVDVAERGTCYDIVLRDLGIELNYPVYLYGDDGWLTSNQHLRTVLNDPMSLITDVLVNQIGYASGRINATAQAYYKANLFPGLTLSFSLSSPPRALDFITGEICKALYGFGFWNYAGEFTPHYFAGQPAPAPVLDLWDGVNMPALAFKSGIGAAIQSPLPEVKAGDYYTILEYQWDYNGSDYDSTAAIEAVGAPPDLSRQKTIQSQGLLSPLGGGLYARLVGYTLTQRYGARPALLSVEIDWTGIGVEPGDLVYVSHPQIKLGGKIGLNYEIMEVKGITPGWTKGTVQLDLLDVPYLNVGPYTIAPNGTGAWTAGGAATSYLFIAGNATKKYSDGTPGRQIYP